MSADFISDFRKEMATAGLDYTGDLHADSKLHRVKFNDDTDAAGWYVLYPPDPVPAGSFGCWKRGIKMTVCLKNGQPELSAEEWKKIRDRFAQADKLRAQAETERHLRAQQRAIAMCENATTAANIHPYLQRKHVACYGDMLEGTDEELILPLRDVDGTIHSVQTITADGVKRFLPGGRVQGCFYVVNHRLDCPIVICEGYATGATIFEATGWAVIAALNCGNLLTVAKTIREKMPDKPIIIAADNDERLLDADEQHRERGLTKAREAAKAVKGAVAIPNFPDEDKAGTDFNDLALAAGLEAVNSAFEQCYPSPLSFLTFAQILIIPTLESDRILGDHLLDKGNPLVIVGQGGTGKSRLVYQLMASCVRQDEKFLNFDLHLGASQLKWLVIQVENSVRRLKQTAESMRTFTGDRWKIFNDQVHVLTPLNDNDLIVSLDNPDAVSRLKTVITRFSPDIVIFDSLYDFSIGDLNKDVDMRSTLLAMSRLSKFNNPKRSMIILHHSLTGQSGAARAMGYDRTSFSRNSKVLYNWTRAQINLAPVSPENNEQLVISCAKCSDGREFPAFPVRLNPETLLYEPDDTVDVNEWSAGVKGNKPSISSEDVANLCPTIADKLSLSRIICQEEGCGKAAAYRYIKSAINSGKLREKNGKLFKT